MLRKCSGMHKMGTARYHWRKPGNLHAVPWLRHDMAQRHQRRHAASRRGGVTHADGMADHHRLHGLARRERVQLERQHHRAIGGYFLGKEKQTGCSAGASTPPRYDPLRTRKRQGV